MAAVESHSPVGEDKLCIEMLGAGQEVGRSCCVIRFKDHAAALTYVMEKTNFCEGKGKVYMTHPTKAIYRFLMSDFVRISNAGSDRMLFDESEMLASWRQIEAVDYHQEVVISGGLRFTPYHAGHVLGACMFMIEMAGLRVLYTGDYSREEDRHLVQAEVPPVRPDVLICESTYGTQSLEPRLDKEMRFTSLIHNIIKRGGRVLLPVFVLGRAQELLLLLDEYWEAHPELHSVPIYYASSLARKCMSIYQTYIHTMNQHIRSRFHQRDNPFVFKHVSNLRSLDKFDDKGPCVMMASPGFMQSGISRELLERWAPDKRNGVIVSGYSVEGTMARDILSDPDEIVATNGQRIPRRMSVDYISFSAHVDYTQNSRFIDEVKAKHIVLVHGELKNMSGLRAALQSRYSDRDEEIHIYMPRNCDPLYLSFRAERTAKVIGSLASHPPKTSEPIDGLLVAKDFSYTVLAPEDLTEFTGLGTSTIVQRQRVALHVGWELARWHLEGMYGRLDEGVDEAGVRCMRVMNVVDIKQPRTCELLLEWESSASNDMVADSIVALLLGIDSCPASVKRTMHDHACAHHHAASPKASKDMQPVESLMALLEAHFGPVEMMDVGNHDTATPDAASEPVAPADATEATEAPSALERLLARIPGPVRPALYVTLDDEPILVDLDGLAVYCDAESLQHRVERLVAMVQSTTQSLADTFQLVPVNSAMLFQGAHNDVAQPVPKIEEVPKALA